MKRHILLATVVGMLLLLLGIFISIQNGAKQIPLSDIISVFFSSADTLHSQLILDVRLPRLLASILCGGLLAMSGAMTQGILKNPVAEPSILGITQGATMFVALSSFLPAFPILTSPFPMAIFGAAISGLLIFSFSLKKGIRQDISMLLLAGTALSMLFLSLASIFALLQNRSQELAFWIAGGFRNISWFHVHGFILITIIAFLAIFFLAQKINLLSLGDEAAIGLGISPNKIRRYVLFLMIPICAICVASAGNIAFVGLFIPHILRKIIGNDYRSLLPLSFLYGGVLLLFADVLARTISAPYELPVGLFTTFLGIPVFLLQVRKEIQ